MLTQGLEWMPPNQHQVGGIGQRITIIGHYTKSERLGGQRWLFRGRNVGIPLIFCQRLDIQLAAYGTPVSDCSHRAVNTERDKCHFLGIRHTGYFPSIVVEEGGNEVQWHGVSQ